MYRFLRGGAYKGGVPDERGQSSSLPPRLLQVANKARDQGGWERQLGYLGGRPQGNQEGIAFSRVPDQGCQNASNRLAGPIVAREI